MRPNSAPEGLDTDVGSLKGQHRKIGLGLSEGRRSVAAVTVWRIIGLHSLEARNVNIEDEVIIIWASSATLYIITCHLPALQTHQSVITYYFRKYTLVHVDWLNVWQEERPYKPAPTIHTVTFGVAHIKTGRLHVCRKNIPPLVLVTQCGLCACWTPLTSWGMDTTGKQWGNHTGLVVEKRMTIGESCRYVSSHRNRSQLDMGSMWLCRCYRTQGYREGRVLVLHSEVMSQLQSHPPGRSWAPSTYIWPVSEIRETEDDCIWTVAVE